MRWRALVLTVATAVLALWSCAGPRPGDAGRPAPGGVAQGGRPAPAAPPALTPGAARAAIESADDARRRALGGLDDAGLQSAFSGVALGLLRGQVSEWRRLGVRSQEVLLRRRLAYWRPSGRGSGEAVLEVLVRGRLITPGGPDPPWAQVLAQWQARLRWGRGAWSVVEEVELPPDQWRS